MNARSAEKETASGQGKLRVQIVSPDGLLWEGHADFAVLSVPDGELGIYPAHAPLLARLGVGEARIHAGGSIRYFAFFGGFLEVVEDAVQIIVDRVETPETVDVEKAREELRRLGAEGRKDVLRHEEDLLDRRKARVRLKVAARKA